MRRKRRWRRVLYFFAGLFIAYWAVCYYLAGKYVRPQVTNDGGPPKGFVAVSNPDAWVTPGTREKVFPAKATSEEMAKDRPEYHVFILAHGYGGNQSSCTKVAEALAKDGYEVIIPAMPGHDNLTNETCGFGIKEAQKILDSVKWVRGNWEMRPHITLVGISMGGAACWLASEKDPSIDAVVTEGAFARLDVATNRWFNRKAAGASFFLRPVIWFASAMSGVSPGDVNPVEAAAKWKGKPALVIHGENDSLFAQDDAKDLADAAGAKLWIVPGASHAHCSDLCFDEYIERLEWFAKH